jgi:hypothetical protein
LFLSCRVNGHFRKILVLKTYRMNSRVLPFERARFTGPETVQILLVYLSEKTKSVANKASDLQVEVRPPYSYDIKN